MNTVIAAVFGDIAVVLVVSSLLGAVARRCGQPVVIGQILTGVLLGPSVIERLPGHLASHLIPHQTLPYLTVLSQIAVAIFMFAVGYELDFAKLRGHGRTVPLIATSALAVPMGLGMACVLVFRSSFTAVGEGIRGGRSSFSWEWPCLLRRCRCWPRSFASGAWPVPRRASSPPPRPEAWTQRRGCS